MAISYSTPGVYVQEISTLAPSVVPVSTAIPVFIGYTEKGPKIARINSLLEYETTFGKACPSTFKVTTKNSANTPPSPELDQLNPTDAKGNPFLMYYGINLYFLNGGGSCYVISLGDYSNQASKPAKADFVGALKLLAAEDEPTLIVMLDAVGLSSADYYDLCGQALLQCKELGDRFLIVDVVDGKIGALRDANFDAGTLMYGAAYHPYLQTTLNYQYQESGITVDGLTSNAGTPTWSSSDTGLSVKYTGTKTTAKIKINVDSNTPTSIDFDVSATTNIATLTIKLTASSFVTDIVNAWKTWKDNPGNNPQGFDISANGNDQITSSMAATELSAPSAVSATTMATIKPTQTALYNQIKSALAEQRVVLPPSAAMAGIYARVDRDRGVWKAPGNVSVLSVIGPVSKITNDIQDGLNIDPNAGKSINAIRAFTGKGTLVWGARTLAGNDNEWRYISVRRLFITIEESSRKATAFAVFEPNDATTWLKVKAMIESYLYGLWEQGALAGPTPAAAYFVNVGLGKTMTAQDVLEGRMIVEIGVAAVRPAEFIILRFSHKMQEA